MQVLAVGSVELTALGMPVKCHLVSPASVTLEEFFTCSSRAVF